MGLQLIFVVETNVKCKSDWIYIKDTIERFYQYDQAQTKFTPIYMDGKGRYKNKEKEIKTAMLQYTHSNKENRSIVIFCFDCDEYDLKPEDAQFLKDAKQYCETREYEFVWFCKDVEQVYLGKKIAANKKKQEAATFKSKKAIMNIDEGKLSADNYKINTSNIMKVLDKYLRRKVEGGRKYV